MNPKPHNSRQLTYQSEYDIYRIRLQTWRIIYAIDEVWKEVPVMAIRQRPPYDYDDLDDLFAKQYG